MKYYPTKALPSMKSKANQAAGKKLLGPKYNAELAGSKPLVPVSRTKKKMTQGQAMAKGIERAMDKFRK